METNQNAIATPSVSYHLDGIYVASPYSLQTDFLDLERIEVLRGPQGTLFGQNSTGGAINVVTQAPTTDETYGSADLTVGNHGLLKTRAFINKPISESLAMRASFISNKRTALQKTSQMVRTLMTLIVFLQGFALVTNLQTHFEQTSWHKCFMKIETGLPKKELLTQLQTQDSFDRTH